jgi:hypothetical protein
MEDVLDTYERPPNPAVARLCFDERPCQLIGDLLAPLPLEPGKTRKEDYEYERQGTCVVLLAYDLDRAQRYLQVRPQRTKADYADFFDWLERTHYADVPKVQVVQDNLNTHTYGAFYEHLPVARAYALKNKFEFHFTPKHASWLNMAELEFSALARQALDRRIPTLERLEQEALAWQDERNRSQTRVHWTFTTDNARAKLHRHYHHVNSKN